MAMIIYDPFWKTLKKRRETTYTLVNKYDISSATIYRLKHNMGLTTSTINDLCRILDCKVEDILEYVKD